MRLTGVLRCVSRLPKDYANLPESYVKRSMEQVEWRTPNKPQYQRKVIQRTRYHYNMSRPWTDEFKQANMPGVRRRKIYVEPIVWTVFRGDRSTKDSDCLFTITICYLIRKEPLVFDHVSQAALHHYEDHRLAEVEVLVGRDKGKQGIVNYIVKERNWVTVEGLNCYYRQIRSMDHVQVMKVEAPLLVTTQVALLDPTDNKPTRVEWRYTEEGKKVRVSVRTGRILPIPLMAEETMDYKSKETYLEQPKDTKAKDLEKITYVPKLMTFAQDIMEEMGIKEDRIPAKTYWY